MMMQTLVTLVTANATVDDLSDADYHDIYTELRSKMTLRQLVGEAGNAWSIAAWSKFEHGELPLSRPARNALRHLVGLPELPRTVTEVTAEVNPDAEVWRIGNLLPDRVILCGNAEALTLRVNGAVEIIETGTSATIYSAVVTEVTSTETNAINGTVQLGIASAKRRFYSRPCFSPDTIAMLDDARQPGENRDTALRRILQGVA